MVEEPCSCSTKTRARRAVLESDRPVEPHGSKKIFVQNELHSLLRFARSTEDKSVRENERTFPDDDNITKESERTTESTIENAVVLALTDEIGRRLVSQDLLRCCS